MRCLSRRRAIQSTAILPPKKNFLAKSLLSTRMIYLYQIVSWPEEWIISESQRTNDKDCGSQSHCKWTTMHKAARLCIIQSNNLKVRNYKGSAPALTLFCSIRKASLQPRHHLPAHQLTSSLASSTAAYTNKTRSLINNVHLYWLLLPHLR